MPVTEQQVHEALRTVVDPELHVNIMDLGLIYGVGVDQQDDGSTKLKIVMTLTSPACPFGPELVHQTQEAVMGIEGVVEAEVQITLSPPWTPDRMTEEARDELGVF
jgi:metal-sulfur cluster biosynthetic enzyme